VICLGEKVKTSDAMERARSSQQPELRDAAALRYRLCVSIARRRSQEQMLHFVSVARQALCF
jgi:hypothetical protein